MRSAPVIPRPVHLSVPPHDQLLREVDRITEEEPPTFAELLGRPPWMRDAACLEHPEINFFPERGESAQPAKKVCVACLVREECLDFAVRGTSMNTDHGVWGGTSPQQRNELRRTGR